MAGGRRQRWKDGAICSAIGWSCRCVCEWCIWILAASCFHLLHHKILAIICWTLHAGMQVLLTVLFYLFGVKPTTSFLSQCRLLCTKVKIIFLKGFCCMFIKSPAVQSIGWSFLLFVTLWCAEWTDSCARNPQPKTAISCNCCWCQIWHKNWAIEGNVQESGQAYSWWGCIQHLPLCKIWCQDWRCGGKNICCK